MKSILLTSTALVAFAGAAAADGHATPGIGFAGEATLGYNDDVENGFYWDSSLDVTATAALDNGLVAEATFGLEVVNDNLGEAVVGTDYVLSLTGGGSSLTFGDTDPVAEDRWGGVDGMEADNFNDQDVHFDVAGFEAMLVGETTVAGFTAAVSFGVDSDDNTAEDTLDAMQIHVGGDIGNFNMELAYQEEFAGTGEIIAVAVGGSFAGADVTVAYADNSATDITSTGIEVAYPVGPVVLGAYYTMNDGGSDDYGVSADYSNGPIAVSASFDDSDADEDDTESYAIEGSYDLGNGLMILAGVLGNEGGNNAYYVAGEYDLGGGAELLVSYAEDEDNDTNDEIGDPEYLHGTTVEVSFAF